MSFEITIGWESNWRRDCFQAHSGLWLVHPTWIRMAVENLALFEARMKASGSMPEEPRPYALSNGVAVIPLVGPMMKGDSKYGGVSTVRARRIVRQAAADPEVKAIQLFIDSPGGTAAGTEELAKDVAAARAAKPIQAHIDDLGASAAYWVASQTDRITAGPTAEVGSIGTMAIIDDLSGRAEQLGIKVHVISTGPFKGAGVEGTKITEEQLDYFREFVGDLNDRFVSGIAAGRKIAPETVREKWGSGKTWIAEKALKLGLVDEVMSHDEALQSMIDSVSPKEAPRVHNVSRKLSIQMAKLVLKSRL